jgi:hypothetical protein
MPKRWQVPESWNQSLTLFLNENKFVWFYVVCTVHFIVSLSQNQQIHKIIDKYKMYLQPLHMFRQINCHPQWVFIIELQVRIASKYTIVGFTVLLLKILESVFNSIPEWK